MSQTHSNFKSYVDGINNAIDIYYEMWSPLERQTYVRKRTTPIESLYWNDDDLQKFTLRIEDIDRLYFYEMSSYPFRKIYEIVARVNPQGFYVQLYLKHYTQTQCDKNVSGLMYISENPNLFIKVIRHYERNTKYSLKRIMYTSLKSEGIHLKDEEEEVKEKTTSEYNDKIKKQPKKLCNLCYGAIYENNDILEEIYINQLPIVLKHDISRYIDVRDAMIDYNEYICR